MRAAVFTGIGQELSLESLTCEDPGPGEVAVRVEASGVCHSDLHVIDGDWDEASPLVLGHEGCGLVERVGEGVIDVRPGDRVILSWYAPCTDGSM